MLTLNVQLFHGSLKHPRVLNPRDQKFWHYSARFTCISCCLRNLLITTGTRHVGLSCCAQNNCLPQPSIPSVSRPRDLKETLPLCSLLPSGNAVALVTHVLIDTTHVRFAAVASNDDAVVSSHTHYFASRVGRRWWGCDPRPHPCPSPLLIFPEGFPQSVSRPRASTR